MYKNILIILISFILGFYLSGFIKINSGEKKELDYSFLNEVLEKMDEKFVDTREDKEKKISDDDKVFGAAAGLVASYSDRHTSFFPPEDSKLFTDDISGEFSGVGMEITNKGGYLTVVSPLPDSPAKKAGIRSKDIVSKIDGVDSLGMPSHEAVKLIRGKEGEDVLLEIIRKNEDKPLEISVKRGKIKIPVVKTSIHGDVFVIKLFTFSENSSKLFFSKIAKEFKDSKKDKMIIDLRGNSGGLLGSGIFISGLFLEEGKIIVKEDYQGRQEEKIWLSGDNHANPGKTTDIFNNLKLGVLVDGGSASASEILAGTLLDNKKAIIFGENTFGKGTVQELIEFSNGSSVKITVAKFILPNGKWISYEGILPDVKFEFTEDDYEKSREVGSYDNFLDSQLKNTINYLTSIKNQKEFNEKIEEFSRIRVEMETDESQKEKAQKLLDEK